MGQRFPWPRGRRQQRTPQQLQRGQPDGSGTDNLIVGGNLTKVSTNFNGGLLVNGNVNWETPTISGRVAVNGNATFTGGGNIAGPVTVAGTYSAPPWYPANNPGTTPLPFDFSEVGDYLVSQSAFLATLPVNGTTSIAFNQVHLTADNPGDTYVSFNVTGAEMAAAAGAGLHITAPAGATVVVNVSGAVDSMSNIGIFLNGVDNRHVLYNFFEATSLTLASIGVQGTILAPLADVDFASGNIDSTLIAKNLTGMGEAHLFLFEGDLPLNPVPEPSTIVLGLMGLAALAVHGLRVRGARGPVDWHVGGCFGKCAAGRSASRPVRGLSRISRRPDRTAAQLRLLRAVLTSPAHLRQPRFHDRHHLVAGECLVGQQMIGQCGEHRPQRLGFMSAVEFDRDLFVIGDEFGPSRWFNSRS